MTSGDDFITEIFTRMNSKTCSTIKSFHDACQVHMQWLENFPIEALQAKDFDGPRLPKTPVSKSKKRPARSSSDEEVSNTSKQIMDTDSTLNTTGKPKRNASKMASMKINEQSHVKLNTKMRRPGSIDKENQLNDICSTKNTVAVKVEKDVEPPTEAPRQALIDATNDNMPPPLYKPKRGRKKIKSEIAESADGESASVRTSSRPKRTVKKEVLDDKPTQPKIPAKPECPAKPKRSTRNQHRPDSDVVIQEVPVPVYTISDDDTDIETVANNKPDTESKQTDATGYASSALSEAESNADERTDKPTDTEDEEPTKKERGRKKKKTVKRVGKKAEEKKVLIEADDQSVDEDTVSASKLRVLKKKPELDKKKRNGDEKRQDVDRTKQNADEESRPKESGEVRDQISEKSARKLSNDDVQQGVNNMNCTVTIEKANEVPSTLNSTQVIQKEIDSLLFPPDNLTLNTTHVIETEKHSPKTKQLLKETGINFNCTVVLDKLNTTTTLNSDGKNPENLPVNTTRVLSPKQTTKSHWQKKDQRMPPSALENLLTDDDDSIEVSTKKQTPVKKTDKKKAAKTKPMFSPYANSPVKKRVAAFEQLGTGTADMPTRVTRTKTKMLAEKESELQKEETASRLKGKYVTPIMSKKIPSLIPHTDGKQYRTQTFAANKMYNTSTMSSDISVKSATAVKPTRADLQERKAEEQRRREEREVEVKRKKEALMQAKIEEQKRKREEKQMKAQKAREHMDREKEEKLKQMLQEKEDKINEEQQRKREWAAKKASEMEGHKKMEEQMKLLKIREYEAKKKQEELRRAKFNMKPPPLPTEDCDDSDSSSENVKTSKCLGPVWGQRKQLLPHLMMMRHIPKCFIETFFQMQATTPDLREIFESVDEKVLRRNSSAVWRTPPRDSTLPKF